MVYSYSIQPAKRTVVDIPATSRLLKELRNKNGYSVKQLLEGLADIEEGRGQNFEQAMKKIRKKLEK